MDHTTNERLRRFRERLYKAGFKEVRAWVKRKEGKKLNKTSINEFVRVIKKETSGMSEIELTRMLNLLIKIANGRKEVIKLRKKK